MELIKHRVNTSAELRDTSTLYGVEIDLRSRGTDLILQHDPFREGELFADWLKGYRHGTLILDVKEEGLEDTILEMLKNSRVENYFFLDMSFPFLVRKSLAGLRNIALRFSEYESMETIGRLRKHVSWVWVDCFHGLSLSREEGRQLREWGLKTCLVSPELVRKDPSEIDVFRREIQLRQLQLDAVCTKFPQKWSDSLT